MAVLSWAGSNAGGLLGCLHFSLILAASLGSPAPCSPPPDKLLPFDSVHCAQCSPHRLCPSVVFFVISYLRSAWRAICVNFHLLFSGWCRDYLLNSCADRGWASVSPISPEGKASFSRLSIRISIGPLSPISKCLEFSAVLRNISGRSSTFLLWAPELCLVEFSF